MLREQAITFHLGNGILSLYYTIGILHLPLSNPEIKLLEFLRATGTGNPGLGSCFRYPDKAKPDQEKDDMGME